VFILVNGMNLQNDHMPIKDVNWVFESEDIASMSDAKTSTV